MSIEVSVELLVALPWVWKAFVWDRRSAGGLGTVGRKNKLGGYEL